MPRKAKFIAEPSRLSHVLKTLTQSPRLSLPLLNGLQLTLAKQNNDFGARHFLKEQLPRIRYANQDLAITIKKVPRSREETWKPELVLQYKTGASETLDLSNKWSTVIIKELMERAGGASWAEWKVSARAAGLPLVPGEEGEKLKGKAPPKVVPKAKLAEAFKGLPDYSGPAIKEGIDKKESADVDGKLGVAAALP